MQMHENQFEFANAVKRIQLNNATIHNSGKSNIFLRISNEDYFATTFKDLILLVGLFVAKVDSQSEESLNCEFCYGSCAGNCNECSGTAR